MAILASNWAPTKRTSPRSSEHYEKLDVGRDVGSDATYHINDCFYWKNGGRGGIRTHDTGLPHTRFPSVRLQPLGHPSAAADNAQGGGSMQRRNGLPGGIDFPPATSVIHAQAPSDFDIGSTRIRRPPAAAMALATAGPQPNLVPVRPTTSRIAHNRGIYASKSSVRC